MYVPFFFLSVFEKFSDENSFDFNDEENIQNDLIKTFETCSRYIKVVSSVLNVETTDAMKDYLINIPQFSFSLFGTFSLQIR